MADHFAEGAKLPSTKTIFRGIQGFILFSVVGIALAFWWKTPADITYLGRYVDGFSLALLIPLLACDYIIGGIRYRLFFNGKILPRISMLNCMRSNWANIFLGSVTPFQTGGGPAQIYILWRSGAKISEAVLVSLLNFSATLLFFLVASFIALMWIPADLFDNSFMPFLQTAFVVIAAVAAMILLLLTFPSSCLILIRKVLHLFPARLVKLHAAKDRWLSVLEAETEYCHDLFVRIRGHRGPLLILIAVATTVLFLNKYLMGYVIAKGLGQEVHFSGFVGLQILHHFSIYFAPTPGASGVAEISSTWLLGKMLSGSVLLYYTIIWRFMTTTLAAFIGCFVILLDLRKRVKYPFIAARESTAKSQ